MMIAAIAAMSENRVIGRDNQLPWHLPADLQHFKQLTLGKTILMGRKTYQSIGKPLPNRRNIIITRDVNFSAAGCETANSIPAALALATDQEEIFIIGGAELYRAMLPVTQRIYLTLVHHVCTGDTFFPELPSTEWQERECIKHPADEKNQYAFDFMLWERS